MAKQLKYFVFFMLSSLVAISPLLSACGCSTNQVSHDQKVNVKKMSFPDSEFWRKGGVGIIVEDVYVDLTSQKNKLLLEDKRTWEGLESSKNEIVVVYRGKVYPQAELPSDFKISNSIWISFQVNRVYFYDFSAMDGGYYSR